MALSKRLIDIADHAHHRAVTRFGWTKPEATGEIRKALRGGDWYPSPETPGEYLVLARIETTNMCVICGVENTKVHVRTLYPLRNPSKLHPYKKMGGPYKAREIKTRHGLDG